MLGTQVHNAISHKVEKERKPRGENPPPKREMKRDAWMDGVIKAPPLRHTSSIYKSEEGEEQVLIRGKSPPIRKKRKRDKVVPPAMKNADQ